MKLKIFIISFLLLFFAVPVFAIENFDSYSSNYNIDNESKWTYNYGDHLQIKSSNYNSSPNSLAHSDGNGSLNTTYSHGEDFDKFQIAIRDNGSDYGQWRLYFKDGTSNLGSLLMRNNTLQWDGQQDFNCGSLTYGVYSILYIEFTSTQVRCKLDENSWSSWHNHYYNLPDKIEFDHNNDPSNTYFDDMLVGDEEIVFAITDPEMDDPAINDSWITVSGTCPTNGTDRIGFTNDCLGFDNIDYTVDCVDNEFSGQFYHEATNHRLIARDIDSISGDCVDYDDLMDIVEVDGIEVIEGYPDDWYFNFDYYDDYDIKIKSPIFDTSLTLPANSTSTIFTFGFTYPASSTLSNLNFNIKQYDSDGNLLNANYHNKDLSNMDDTENYQVSLTASSTDSMHYVVQLTDNGEMVRQYPFGIYVSDLDFVYNPDDYDYFFPRLVEMLRTKIVFNYYFAFHDGFYDMFNGDYSAPADDDLDITFKSVSGDGEYNLDIKIFSASDSRVKYFASKIRPYIVAILWLIFAVYVMFRITHLFSDNQ